MMSFERFLDLRRAERDWAHANGYNNENPETNGALAFLAVMAPAIDDYIDIGAGHGLYAERIRTINPAAKMLLCEPNGARIPGLRNAFPEADVRALALSDHTQEADLYLHDAGGASPSYGASLHRRGRLLDMRQARARSLRVSVRRLDSLMTPAEDRRMLIRLSGNGHEARILRGAHPLLPRSRAGAVMFAFSSAWADLGEGLLDSLRGLYDLGFDIHRVLPYGLERVRVFVADMERAHHCLYVALRGFSLEAAPGWTPAATPYGDAEILPFDDLLRLNTR